MEQPCYKCRQLVEEGRPFCPHCSAPQIRVLVAEPVAAVGTFAGVAVPSESAVELPASQTLPVLALPMRWPSSERHSAGRTPSASHGWRWRGWHYWLPRLHSTRCRHLMPNCSGLPGLPGITPACTAPLIFRATTSGLYWSGRYRDALFPPSCPALCGASTSSFGATKTWMAGHRRAEATPSVRRLCPAMTKTTTSRQR